MKIRKKTVQNWEKHEVAHLKKTLKKVKKEAKKEEEVIGYWVIMLTVVITSFIAAISLASVSLALDLYVLLSVTIALALAFGAVFALWIHELEDLEVRHHITFFIIVILSGTISFLTIFNTPLIKLFADARHIAPVTIFYIIFFTVPYVMKLTREYDEGLDHTVRKNKRHVHKKA